MGAAQSAPVTVLVTGSNGRIGRALRAIWPQNRPDLPPILWHSRVACPAADLVWNIGQNPPPALPPGLIVLHLAGRVAGTPQEFAQNVTLTDALCTAVRQAGARHVFAMSSAAVYRPDAQPIPETATPGPSSPYGHSKLAAEQAARHRLHGSATGLTVLRLGNLAGADALLGNATPEKSVTLDPVAGQSGGPQRSYIGPRVLADVLADLIGLAVTGAALPDLLNVAQPPAVAMAALLTAAGQPWAFGPPRPGVIPRVALATERLGALVTLPNATPASLIADLTSVSGWPK